MNDITNPREYAEQLDVGISSAVMDMEGSIYCIFMNLSKIKQDNLFFYLGHDNFRDYVEATLKRRYARTMRWNIRKILENVPLSKYLLENRQEFNEIGISNAAAMAKVVDCSNLTEWIGKAREPGTAAEFVKQTGGSHPMTLKVTFANAIEYEAVMDGMERLSKHTGVEPESAILVFMMAEVRAGHPQLWED